MGRGAARDIPLRSLQFSQCPPDYHHIHTEISREGARVLALGYKELGHLTHQQVRAQAPPPAFTMCLTRQLLPESLPVPYSTKLNGRDFVLLAPPLASTFGDPKWHSVGLLLWGTTRSWLMQSKHMQASPAPVLVCPWLYSSALVLGRAWWH